MYLHLINSTNHPACTSHLSLQPDQADSTLNPTRPCAPGTPSSASPFVVTMQVLHTLVTGSELKTQLIPDIKYVHGVSSSRAPKGACCPPDKPSLCQTHSPCKGGNPSAATPHHCRPHGPPTHGTNTFFVTK